MSHFDDFFRANYLRMVRYVSNSYSYFTVEDAEEIVSDVIHRYYDDYRARVTESDGYSAESRMRRWMIRRACFDMLSLIRKRSAARLSSADAERQEAEEPDEPLILDDPADWLCLKQRLPPIPQVLIDYETRVDGVPVDPKLTNRHHQAKKRFLHALKGNL